MISVIIPVYNAAPYIEQTLQSVLAQTYDDWELILVDDASTDDSVALIRSFLERHALSTRARLITLDEKSGETAARARNAGIEVSSGRYIAFLDADDLWEGNKLHTQLTFLQMRDAAFTFTAYEFGDEDAGHTGRIVRVPKSLTYTQALSRTVIFTSTVMLDKEKIPADLIRMPEIESEDTATWWQIMRSGITAYGLQECLTVYRRPKKSLSSNKMVALRRIWGLYRHEGIGIPARLWYFAGWAFRATLRRL